MTTALRLQFKVLFLFHGNDTQEKNYLLEFCQDETIGPCLIISFKLLIEIKVNYSMQRYYH